MVRSLQDYPLAIVTGGTGWLGSRILTALREGLSELGETGKGGLRVRCLVSPTEHSTPLNARFIETVPGDLRDPEACRALLRDAEGALVIHTAGVIHPPGRTQVFDEVNVGGTANLLAAARTAQAKRIVAMSSNSPLGCNPAPDRLFDEMSPYRPYMGYGRSKWRMELLLRDAMGSGPEITIVRAPWFYGVGQPPRQTEFFRMIRAGRFPLVGDGRNRRSMGYVDSLASGILLAAACERAAGEIYWLADARPYTMAEIVETVRATLKDDFGMSVSRSQPRLPGFVGTLAQWTDGALQELGLYVQKIHVLSEMNKTIACDISKARRDLGYEPLVELREGMRRSVEWCLANGHRI